MSTAFNRFAQKVKDAFGDGTEPIGVVARRAEELFADVPVIVWEGDAQTFQFSFVSRSAEQLLGYPADRWTREATFWADQVVHPEDRDDAIAYCALATGRGRDHAFEYRARRANGDAITLVDYVQVIFGRRGLPERLRGIMIDVGSATDVSTAARWESPSRTELEASTAVRA